MTIEGEQENNEEVLLKCVYKQSRSLIESYVKTILLEKDTISYLACDEKGKCFEHYGVYSMDVSGFLNIYEYVAPTWEAMNDIKNEIESSKPSYVDEVKQNKDIIKKYKLIEPNDCMFSFDQVCEVIKMLEVKLFSAEASLKLSQELIKQMEVENKEFRKWNKPLNGN